MCLRPDSGLTDYMLRRFGTIQCGHAERNNTVVNNTLYGPDPYYLSCTSYHGHEEIGF